MTTMNAQYEVIVGNIGSVYYGTDKAEAEACVAEYVDQSTSNYGRAAGEPVTLLEDGEPIYELSVESD
jgi:hypothetical protein